MFKDEKFLKGEITATVTEQDGSKKEYNVTNAVLPAWTNALFQVICQGHHNEYSHTIGKLTVTTREKPVTSNTTDDEFAVGNTQATQVQVTNGYNSSTRVYYVKINLVGASGNTLISGVTGSGSTYEISRLRLFGSGAGVPITGASDQSAVPLADTGASSNLGITITTTSSVTLDYRINLPAHSVGNFVPRGILGTSVSNVTGWQKKFLGALCDVMTYGMVKATGGMSANHGLGSHANDSKYNGNSNIRVTSCMLHKFNDTGTSEEGSSENGNKDEHYRNHDGTTESNDAIQFNTAIPKSHKEINNDSWDYSGQSSDNSISTSANPGNSPANTVIGSLQKTASASVDEAENISLSWTDVGNGQVNTKAPDLLVFYCRTITQATKDSATNDVKFNRLHVSDSIVGHVVAYVLNFDDLDNFTPGDNINGTFTFQLSPS